jgi:hypothetical protein
MATQCSFDITSNVDLQEVDNALNQARKEVAQRYDFKGASAVAVESLRNFQRARMNFGVIGPMYGAFDGSRDDLLRTVILRRVFDNPVAKQRPVLHQSEHTHFPPMVRSLPRSAFFTGRPAVGFMDLT